MGHHHLSKQPQPGLHYPYYKTLSYHEKIYLILKLNFPYGNVHPEEVWALLKMTLEVGNIFPGPVQIALQGG